MIILGLTSSYFLACAGLCTFFEKSRLSQKWKFGYLLSSEEGISTKEYDYEEKQIVILL